MLSFWACMARHAQSTQNNKSPVSLQYLKENLKDEVDFPPADKRRRFLQIDTIICKTFTYFKGVQSCWLLLVIVHDKHLWQCDCCLAIKASFGLTFNLSVSESYLLTLKHFTKYFFDTAHWLSQIFILRISWIAFRNSQTLWKGLFLTFTWVVFTSRRSFLFYTSP